MLSARRSLIGEPLGHLCDGSEGLGCQGALRHRLQVCRAVTDSQSLRSRAFAQEAHHGQKLRSGSLGELNGSSHIPSEVASPLLTIVVDFEVPSPFAANLEDISLPKSRQLRGARARGRAQHSVILDHDGERCGKRENHRELPASAVTPVRVSPVRLIELWSPRRLEPMNLSAAGSGAMITCTLSESLSARVFWIRSG